MKGNYESIAALAAEIERREGAKDDLLVPTGAMSMKEDGGGLEIAGNGGPGGSYGLTDYAHGQLAEYLAIPKGYYDRIEKVPGLRAANVNSLLATKPKERRLVRTLDGSARAVLSDRFKPLDNYLMMQAILPVLREHEVQVVSSTLTDTRMYLQAVFPRIEGEVRKGDVVQAGLIFRNSEVGRGYYEVEELLWFLWCINGAVGQSLLRKHHAGRRVGDLEEDYNIYRDDTIKAELESFRLRTRDIVANALTETSFQNTLIKLRRAREDKIADPVPVVERVTKRYELPEGLAKGLIPAMAEDRGGFTRYGLAQGITGLAKELEDRDRQYDLEKAGHDLLVMAPSEWEAITEVDEEN
jgi:hypothetical protein